MGGTARLTDPRLQGGKVKDQDARDPCRTAAREFHEETHALLPEAEVLAALAVWGGDLLQARSAAAGAVAGADGSGPGVGTEPAARAAACGVAAATREPAVTAAPAPPLPAVAAPGKYLASGRYVLLPLHLPPVWGLPRACAERLAAGGGHPEGAKVLGLSWLSLGSLEALAERGGLLVALRVHDACFTSEVLGSLKCDCAEQLELALNMIQKEPPGIVIYLQQEGRGIGLANKIAAYSLQEQGLDTVDANRALGLPDDCREYTSVRNMLLELGVKSIRLITNNPRKINVLTKLGIQVTGRIPCLVEAGAYNQGYLEAKRDRMAHMLPEGEAGSGDELNGDFCFWDHDGEPTQAVATVYAKGGMDLPVGLAHGDNGRVVPVAAGSAEATGNGASV
ncbi:hypothetical protein GPECTOR_18g94 [Gonium pectorale]|uniref:GTP cyclohydrolase II n=1 Tax=Gonium pectorale TaxID=33097 RepID=A0A150GLD3_GONPE|nr:hypothetical protein GPECTOR_18g94 [Gonium pectorale]|eukprot:KXZ50120.1 hypothetical protein GPECTOR_18g94 [Gonium pectorale]